MSDKNFAHRILITAKDEASAIFSSLQTKAVAVASAIAGFFGIQLFGDSIRAADELDVQMRKLQATIEATGGAAGLTAAEIDQLARELDEATLGSASGFRDAAAQLLTFKSVSGETFKTTLRLAQDLAATGFGNLEGNVVQLGKALESPINGLGALGEAGVTFTDQQKELIKTLIATGQHAKAQGVILEAVAGQVGGVASAVGGGLAGVRDLIGKLTTDIQEAFGAKLLPALSALGTKVADTLRAFRDSGAVEALGNSFAYLADRADKLGKIAAVAVGVVAVNAMRAYSAALGAATLATGAKTIATGLLAGALNAVVAAGRAASGAVISLGSALAGATTAVREKVTALGALRTAFRAVGWAMVVDEVVRIATNLVALREESAKQQAALQSLEENQRRAAERYREISAATGVAVTNMRELEAAVQDGRIRFDEASASWVAGAQSVAAVGTAAEVARFKLSEVQLQFQQLAAEGANTVDALAKIIQAADFSTVDGVAKLITDIDQLKASAYASGEQIQTSLVDRLSKLSSQDLRDFGIQAEMAFDQGALSAEQLATALDAQATAALQRLGIEASAAFGGLSTKFKEAAGNVGIIESQFDRLTESGVNAGAVLQQAIEGALGAASHPDEFTHLANEVKRLGTEGKLAEAAVTAALTAIRNKADEATPGVNSLTEALKTLGIVSDAALKETAAKFKEAHEAVKQMGGSLREQEASFRRYAEAAVAANGGVADAALQAEAAHYGLQVAADTSGQLIVTRMGEAAQVMSDLQRNTAAARTEMDELKQSTESTADMFARWQKELDARNAPGTTWNAGGTTWEAMSEDDLLAYASGLFGKDAANFALKELERRRSAARNAIEARDNPPSASGGGAASESGSATRGTRRGGTPGFTPGGETVSTRHEVAITFGGRRQTIGTRTAEDATNLAGIMRELQDYAARAG